MLFKVSPEIFNTYPQLLLGLLVIRQADNAGASSDIVSLLRQAEASLRATPDIEPISEYPRIANWRGAHKQFGSKPSRYAPSIQALVKRVVKGGELPSINKLVDLYNYISLKHIMPVGGEDLDKCSSDIELAFARGDESFTEIGGTENNPPEAGEVVYRDEVGVLCRKFNWHEADRTKLTEQTSQAVLVIEALPPVSRSQLDQALSELKELVQKYCGGDVQSEVLDKDRNRFEF